jgi:hypothetical protein
MFQLIQAIAMTTNMKRNYQMWITVYFDNFSLFQRKTE